jgi:hypothetical protein
MVVTSQYMNILARVALENPDLLLRFVRTPDASPDIVSRLLKSWAGQKVPTIAIILTIQFDNIAQPKSRKLNAMGITALLRTNDPDVISNFGSIMNVWFNLLSEVRDSEGGEYSLSIIALTLVH